jgi:hypothetical protein
MARSNRVLRAPAAIPTDLVLVEGEVDAPGEQQVIKGTLQPQADSVAEDGALASAVKVKSCQPEVEGVGFSLSCHLSGKRLCHP